MKSRARAKKSLKAEPRGTLTLNPRANSHPDRIRSMIAALTEGIMQCQFATNS
jgi:hypothetical protein